MSKPAPSDFVREAIREKAARELVVLNQRVVAFDGVERAKETIARVSGDLATTASALAAVGPEASVVSKLKRLRKAIDEAQALSSEIAESLAIVEQRAAAEVARTSILRALEGAGLDPEALVRSAAE